MALDAGLDPAQRFSSRAEAYARYRPTYPRETLDLLERECGLTAACKIADIGSDDMTVLLCRNGELWYARTVLGGGRRLRLRGGANP